LNICDPSILERQIDVTISVVGIRSRDDRIGTVDVTTALMEDPAKGWTGQT